MLGALAAALDLSPRTARRLVRLARAEHAAPEVASAFREGRITLLQAEVLLRGGSAEACVKLEMALQVTLRRLEEEGSARGTWRSPAIWTTPGSCRPRSPTRCRHHAV